MIVDRAINKIHAEIFNLRMNIHGRFGIPLQTGIERQIFKMVFDSVGHDKKNIKVFEWGSGLSTIYYADYLSKKKISFKWHAIDNNELWYQKVDSMLNEKDLHHNVTLYLKSFDPFWEKSGWGPIPPPKGIFSPKSENEVAYIDYPKYLNMKFDIIIVDARFRRHCIQTAKKYLNSNGVVIMHDAQKTHYHVGIEDYPYQGFVRSGKWSPFQKQHNRIWIGFNEKTKLFEQLMDFK